MPARAALSAAALLALAAPAVAQAPAPAAPAGDERPLPGFWEYQTRITIFPVSKQRRCLKPEEIERFLFNPCTRRYRCDYPVKEIGGGRMRLDGTWTDKKGRVAPVKASGTYGPRQMTLNANVRTVVGLPVTGQITARWLGETCPAGGAG